MASPLDKNTTPREPWLARFLRFFAQLVMGISWIYSKIVEPIKNRVWRFGKWVFWTYHKHVWDRLVYRKSGHFSWVRSGVVILSTAAAVTITVPLLSLILSAGLYAVSNKTEQIYLSEAQELDPDGDKHMVRGCEKLDCGEDDTVYFRVEPSIFNHTWSMLTRGRFFFADLTSSVVAPGVNVCTVHSYGWRLKFLMRNWDIYPVMLDGTCRPISDAEAQAGSLG